jgi:hypothetical protein
MTETLREVARDVGQGLAAMFCAIALYLVGAVALAFGDFPLIVEVGLTAMAGLIFLTSGIALGLGGAAVVIGLLRLRGGAK